MNGLLFAGWMTLAAAAPAAAWLDLSPEDPAWLEQDRAARESFARHMESALPQDLLWGVRVDEYFREAPPAGVEARIEEARQSLQRGREFYELLKPERAIQHLQAALKTLREIGAGMPDLSLLEETHFLLGMTFQALGQTSPADDHYRMVLLLRPDRALDEAAVNPLVVERFERVRQNLAASLPGSISIISTPAGGRVGLDGRPVGRTPLTLSGLSPGEHYLSLAADGYRPWFGLVLVPSGGLEKKEIYPEEGARIILNTWEIRDIYQGLIADYKEDYIAHFGRKGPWPLLIEARMSGVEISFTILVDKLGNFRILPTALDYPERFEGPPGLDNPITGGMGSISPHPLESPALLSLAEERLARPLIAHLQRQGLVRPCVLYPGCFASFSDDLEPRDLRICEINVRPGEPEFQPVVKRLRNLGALMAAMVSGRLDEVEPEVRHDQISLCIALVTGPGGPKQQKGYPWSLTKGEPVVLDWEYFDKKKITVIPSAMDYQEGTFKSDGSRVAYLVANATVKEGQKRGQVAETLRLRLLNAYDQGKIRVLPREDEAGNRLALRRDIGLHFQKAERLRAAP